MTRTGLTALLAHVADLVERTPTFPIHVEDGQGAVYKFAEKEPKFEIMRDDDGAFVVKGAAVERLFRMTDFNRDESVRRFARALRRMGVDDALREHGIEDGDTVRILDFEFEFVN